MMNSFSPPASSTPFIWPDLRIWTPRAGAVSPALTRTSFKKALVQQGIDIRDHAVRREIIYNMSLGGLGERPYGDLDKNVYFRQRIGHDSAQARSRLINVLFDAEKADEKAPLMPDRIAVANHLMVIAYYGDVDWDGKGHRDFRTMMQASYDLNDDPRIKALGKEGHYGSLLDAGVDFLLKEATAGRISNPSMLAGKMLIRHSHATDPMLQAGKNGSRRTWDWLSLLLHQEPSPGDFPAGDRRSWLNAGRHSSHFSLGGSQSWIATLAHMQPTRHLDTIAIPLLERFVNNHPSMDVKEKTIVQNLTGKIFQIVQADARSDRAHQIAPTVPDRQRSRQRP
jgi:hypothetical protein